VVQLLLQAPHLLEQLVGIVGRHLLGDLVEALDHRLGLGDALLHVAEHRLGLVELRLLLEDADAVARHQPRIAVGRLLNPGHQLQQRRFAGAVRADDADLGSGKEGQGDVVKDHLVAVRLADSTHLIDELGHVFKGRC
jgi:hypothetical protein